MFLPPFPAILAVYLIVNVPSCLRQYIITIKIFCQPSLVFSHYGKIQGAMIINMNKKVVFKKRIPEPKEMGREEMRVFYIKV